MMRVMERGGKKRHPHLLTERALRSSQMRQMKCPGLIHALTSFPLFSPLSTVGVQWGK